LFDGLKYFLPIQALRFETRRQEDITQIKEVFQNTVFTNFKIIIFKVKLFYTL